MVLDGGGALTRMRSGFWVFSGWCKGVAPDGVPSLTVCAKHLKGRAGSWGVVKAAEQVRDMLC